MVSLILKIMRAIQSTGQLTTGDTADLIGRTITGETSEQMHN